MIKPFKINHFFVMSVLTLTLLYGCTKKTHQVNSNLNNFENQDFMASRTMPTPGLTTTNKEGIAVRNEVAGKKKEERIDLIVKQKIAKSRYYQPFTDQGSLKPADVKKEVKKALKEIKKEAKNSTKAEGGKSQVVALILVILVGILGIHRFYLGYIGIGIIQLLTLGGCGIWSLIDLIRIAIGDLKPKDGNYQDKL